jgi:dTMP kinase
MSPGPGRFLVLEGIDGAGTTTQVARLAAALRAEGHPVLTTREPSGGPVGTLLRQALSRQIEGLSDAALALLFAADRVHHLATVVEPALAEGQVVISDRYLLSSLAYQGHRLPMAWVETVNARARRPDLTLYLEVSPGVARLRRQGRGGPAELFDDDALQMRVGRAYGRVIRRHRTRQRVVRVDGEAPPDAVTAVLLDRARAVLRRRRR